VETQTYTVATNSFLAEGGGQYPHMASSQHKPTGATVRDALKAWLKGPKGCSYDRSPRVQERQATSPQ
jgi:2',3'-cyclic-nucleotide 2'-phosphodiesterase (5'-nucleotidase family)